MKLLRILLFFFLFSPHFAFAQKKIVWSEGIESIHIENVLEFLPSQTHEFSYEEVSTGTGDFMPYEEDKLPVGIWVWLRFKIYNNTDRQQDLFVCSSRFDYIDFFLQETDKKLKIKSSGNLINNKDKDVLYANTSLALLKLPPHTERIYYMRVKNETKPGFQFIKVIPTIYKRSVLESIKNNRHSFNLIFIGAVIIMAIYNLFLLFIVNDKTYLVYVCYNLSILSYAYALSGEAVEEVFATVELQDHIVLYAGIAAMVFYVLFSIRILDMPVRYPKLVKVLKAIIVLLLLSLVLTITDYLTISIPICFTAAVFGYTLILFIAINSVREQYRPAKYFLIANTFYYLGVIISILQMLELIPQQLLGLNSSSFTELGVVLELSFFSLSLGDRINMIKDHLAQEKLAQERIKREEEAKRVALIEKQKNELEYKVRERTKELNERNEEIEQQNEELAVQAEILSQQKAEIQIKNQQLDKTNQDITASINYAERIQTAMLPFNSRIKKHWGADYFILYKPKDVVSGDFYWFEEKKTKLFWIAADCTGHGVPGALMSMIGMSLLENIINSKGIVNPEEILTELDRGVRHTLKQAQTTSRDGMDMSICVIDKEAETLTYAGAMHSICYVQNNNIHQIKGSKKSIGGRPNPSNNVFTAHTLSLSGISKVYMYSDGYVDQFGGVNNKKFLSKNFRNLLHKTSSLSCNEQSVILNDTIQKWMDEGKENQIDDILVLGFSLT